MRGHTAFRAVIRASEPVAHEPFGPGSNVLNSKGFSSTAGTAACTDSHQQNVYVNKSPKVCMLQVSVPAGSESPAMDGPSLSLHQSRAYTWSPEVRSGHAFEERDSSWRVEAAS